MRANPLLIVCSCVFATACTTPPAAAPQPSLVDTALREALDKIDNKLIAKAAPIHLSPSPARTVTVKWSGSAVELLGAIVLKLHDDDPSHKLELVTRGHPELPLPVSLDVVDMPVERVLALVAAQIDQRADITLEDNSIVVEYRVKAIKQS